MPVVIAPAEDVGIDSFLRLFLFLKGGFLRVPSVLHAINLVEYVIISFRNPGWLQWRLLKVANRLGKCQRGHALGRLVRSERVKLLFICLLLRNNQELPLKRLIINIFVSLVLNQEHGLLPPFRAITQRVIKSEELSSFRTQFLLRCAGRAVSFLDNSEVGISSIDSFLIPLFLIDLLLLQFKQGLSKR